MTEGSDSTDLAERFLRLWEEAWQQVAQDPVVARYWANLFATLQRSTAPAADAAASASSYEHAQPAWQTRGAPPAAAPPVDRGDRLDELATRVAELERSVADLTAAVHGRSARRSRS